MANEVKQLAARTAQAAADIGGQIEAVQQETRRAVEAIHRIAETLGSIAAAQDAIAAAVEQQRAATDRVGDDVDRAAGGSARISEAVLQLAEAQRLTYVQRALARAQDLLDQAGGMDLGEGRLRPSVRDQATSAERVVEVPELLLGGVPLARVEDPRRPAPLVDELVELVGGSCTVFQRLDDAGSMVRVATTVLTPAGRRNTGTVIAHTDAEGRVHPVLEAVLAGRTYTGPATVAGRAYYTAYTGAHAPSGALIGMLYVGLPIEDLQT